MVTAHSEHQISAAPEEVFDKLADMRNELQWNSTVTEMRKATDGAIGPGTRFEGRMKKGVGPMHMEIVEYERPTRIRFRGGGRSADADFAATLAPSDGGTRIETTLQLDPKGLGKLFAPIMRRTVPRDEARTIESFKRWIEGG
jgi:uncharacterized protein YndB with AHSA1/START domain